MLSANDVKLYSSLKQKKFRDKYGKFLIEEVHLIEKCLRSFFNVECIITRKGTDLHGHIQTNKRGIKTEVIPVKSFEKITDTETSQGIVGVVSKPEAADDGEYGKTIIALDRVNDPGNLGTIIRSAHWFGVTTIFLSPHSADIYNSKVIRASQGALFHVRLFENVNLSEKAGTLNSKGYGINIFTPDEGISLSNITDEALHKRSLLIFGSESQGVSGELITKNYNRIKIEGNSSADSLNLAVSCGIALYEFTNKRRL